MSAALNRNHVLVDDAAASLAALPSASVDMVLTSPPYFRLRNYRVSGQLGLEPHVDQWVEQLRLVAAQVARVLTPTGSFWLNVADTYATHPHQGAARKGLLLGPERLLLALLRDGWLIRNKIVWAKPNAMPTSVRDRLSCTHESLYLLTRRPDYFFDLDAIRVPITSAIPQRASRRESSSAVPKTWRGPNSSSDTGLAALKAAGRAGHPLGKNPGDVWRIATSGYRVHESADQHHATFPVPLAERAILAGCPEARCIACRRPWRRPLIRSLGGSAVRGALSASCGCAAPAEPGLVLDPFFGAGTTGVAAARHGRDWFGIELNPAFADLARRRIQDARAGPSKRAA